MHARLGCFLFILSAAFVIWFIVWFARGVSL